MILGGHGIPLSRHPIPQHNNLMPLAKNPIDRAAWLLFTQFLHFSDILLMFDIYFSNDKDRE